MIIEDVRDNTDDGSEVVIGKTVEGNKDLGPVKSGTIALVPWILWHNVWA